MGTEQELTLQRIANINAACALVGDNAALDGKVSFRLGRLADFTDSEVRNAQKSQQKKIKAHKDRITGLTDADKARENEKFQDELNDLMTEIVEVKVPKFKYSEFVAAADMTVGGTTYRAGQTLVAVKFFSLMGDLIEDDSKVIGAGVLEKKAQKSNMKKTA